MIQKLVPSWVMPVPFPTGAAMFRLRTISKAPAPSFTASAPASLLAPTAGRAPVVGGHGSIAPHRIRPAVAGVPAARLARVFGRLESVGHRIRPGVGGRASIRRALPVRRLGNTGLGQRVRTTAARQTGEAEDHPEDRQRLSHLF